MADLNCVADLNEDYIDKMEDVLETYEQRKHHMNTTSGAATSAGEN